MRETVPYPGVWELLSDQYAYVVLRPLRVGWAKKTYLLGEGATAG